ncbi:unnamed protein product [Kuraishia capsulata CBS 1993]|uniref:Alpha/beta hydrolase fold-3 domain-containing protein n=1 Tax=Kuraishia capsulata CBS 1993 TaxID=1382522 RepID=W6MK64_9ASCO|nr:uncharacterized protein KUCA_T00002911001 [Kuraishia capsulata CBS 1993]CDK26934.1 unnamed protein product [Kuraishia capsulata CBS 1993]
MQNYSKQVSSEHLYLALVSGKVQKRLFDIRAFLQAYSGIEDSDYAEYRDADNKFSGIWLRSTCRGPEHDLVIFYIPNLLLRCGMPYFYVEYLITLQSLLLVQGFHSPAVFIVDVSPGVDMDANELFMRIINAWSFIGQSHPNAKVIIAGDSFGATIALSLMILIACSRNSETGSSEAGNGETKDGENAKVTSTEDPSTEQESTTSPPAPAPPALPNMQRPFGALLISPLLVGHHEPKSALGEGRLAIWAQRSTEFFRNITLFGKDIEPNPMRVQNVEIWKEAAPEKGMIISHGASEDLQQNLENFTEMIAGIVHTKVVISESSPFLPPLYSFFTENIQDEKEDSAFVLSAIISRMALWHTHFYLHPGSHEPMNPLSIDDLHT